MEFRYAKLLKQNAQRFATLAANAAYFVYYIITAIVFTAAVIFFTRSSLWIN
jgi:hypothetical protein